MSSKVIEVSEKELLYKFLEKKAIVYKPHTFHVKSGDDSQKVAAKYDRLQQAQKRVIKPDQLIERSLVMGLLKIGFTGGLGSLFEKRLQVDKSHGRLHTFIVEPYCAYAETDEMYIAIYSTREEDVIMFYEQGGMEVGDVETKSRSLRIPVQTDNNAMTPSDEQLAKLIGAGLPHFDIVKMFISELYRGYKELHFTYLEINPFVFVDSRDLTSEEEYISDMDAKTVASLKLTILNRNGRVWTMVTGREASVVFTDTICDLGGANELANYGEYSGDPSEAQTFEYAKTILSVMTEGPPREDGKVLIIGGSIANNDNINKTFGGLVKALKSSAETLKKHKVTVLIMSSDIGRQKLQCIQTEAGKHLLPIHIFGLFHDVEKIIRTALYSLSSFAQEPKTTDQFSLSLEHNTAGTERQPSSPAPTLVPTTHPLKEANSPGLFKNDTEAIIWEQQDEESQKSSDDPLGGIGTIILTSLLYGSGSVAYVSRSSEMTRELNTIISQNADGVFDGIAIGGDGFPESTYTEHIARYQVDDRVKMIILLGEVGGTKEYKVVDLLKKKLITKPFIGWCIGTCADHITSDVQFGHAGASANSQRETAACKNAALRAAGAIVPDSFDDLGNKIRQTYDSLVQSGVIVQQPELPPAALPIDYAWARELGLIRKPASFMTSICDERGEELKYAGVPISKVLQSGLGIEEESEENDFAEEWEEYYKFEVLYGYE